MGSSPVASTNKKDRVLPCLFFVVLQSNGVARDLLRPEPQYGDPALNDVRPCGQEKLKEMFSYESDEKCTNFSVDALPSILSNLFNQVFNRTIKCFCEFVQSFTLRLGYIEFSLLVSLYCS